MKITQLDFPDEWKTPYFVSHFYEWLLGTETSRLLDKTPIKPNWNRIDEATKAEEDKEAVDDTEDMAEHAENCGGCAFCQPDGEIGDN